MEPGLIGALIGSAIGVIGGAVGTYFSIKNTAGPKERTFMIRVALTAWLALLAFVAGLLAFPKPFNWLLWVPYGIGLPFGIRWCNRRQTQIRGEEAARRSSGPHDS